MSVQRSKSLGRGESEKRHFAFGSSTPRELSHLNLPHQYRIYDTKLCGKATQLVHALMSSPVKSIQSPRGRARPTSSSVKERSSQRTKRGSDMDEEEGQSGEEDETEKFRNGHGDSNFDDTEGNEIPGGKSNPDSLLSSAMNAVDEAGEFAKKQVDVAEDKVGLGVHTATEGLKSEIGKLADQFGLDDKVQSALSQKVDQAADNIEQVVDKEVEKLGDKADEVIDDTVDKAKTAMGSTFSRFRRLSSSSGGSEEEKSDSRQEGLETHEEIYVPEEAGMQIGGHKENLDPGRRSSIVENAVKQEIPGVSPIDPTSMRDNSPIGHEAKINLPIKKSPFRKVSSDDDDASPN